jgi:hypothetical protein
MQSLLGTKAVAAQDTQTSPSDLSSPKLPEDDPILKKAGLDRLRLLLVYLFSSEKPKQDDFEELKNLLSMTYPDIKLKALEHAKPKSTLTATAYEEVKGGITGIISSNIQSKDRCGDEWDRDSEGFDGSR